MENNKPQEKSIMNLAIKGIALVIGLFIIGNVIGSLSNVQYIDSLNAQNNLSTTAPTVSESNTTVPSTTEPTTVPSTTEAPTTTTKPTTTAPTTTQDTTPDTKEEIVAIFNKGANNVKKNATKVVRNYENLHYDEHLSDYPRILNIAYGNLIDSWLVNHDTPIEYTEDDLIKANFPVKGETWSSKLTASDVADARIIEKDGQYQISLDLVYCKNPAENTGVCAVMNSVPLEKIQELVPTAVRCDTEYYDCKVECIIDKDSGNLVYIKYTQPMIFNILNNSVQ
jgi:uncharacterized membrane-anchored protein YhcB (DUF1043 family)